MMNTHEKARVNRKGRGSAVVLGGVLATLILLSLQGCQRTTKVVREGDRAPDFSLQGLDGRTASLASLKGRVVLVHFWATWCPPCVDEIPALEQLYRSMAGKNADILAVSVDEGGAQVVGPFAQRFRLSLPVLLDPDRSVASRYGTFKFPETYVLDREGIVRYKVIGPLNWMDPAVARRIGELLNK